MTENEILANPRTKAIYRAAKLYLGKTHEEAIQEAIAWAKRMNVIKKIESKNFGKH